MNDARSRLLRLTLAVNALSTALCGALLLAAAVPLAPLLGLSGPLPLAVLGALLLAFALEVWRARRQPFAPRRVGVILATDVAYVIASAVLLLAFPGVLSPIGRLATAMVADVVAIFAILEYVGLRRARGREAAAEA
jgi:hypothetical protein